MYTLDSVAAFKEQREVSPGVWALSLPLPGPLRRRLQDAWEVIRGRALAVRESSPRDARHIEILRKMKYADDIVRATPPLRPGDLR